MSGAKMSLLVEEGKATLLVSDTTLETKAQAEQMSAQLLTMAANLPDKKSRSRKPAKRTSSRQTAAARQSRKGIRSDDTEAETASAS